MAGGRDAGDGPGPVAPLLPVGDLESKPKAESGLHTAAHAGGDETCRCLDGAHARAPLRPRVRVGEQPPGDSGGDVDRGTDLEHGAERRQRERRRAESGWPQWVQNFRPGGTSDPQPRQRRWAASVDGATISRTNNATRMPFFFFMVMGPPWSTTNYRILVLTSCGRGRRCAGRDP